MYWYIVVYKHSSVSICGGAMGSSDVTGSCITGSCITGNDVTGYDVTGNEREIISRVFPPAFFRNSSRV